MVSTHSAHCGIDTEATRRQFLFAREQLAAHSPAARARVPQSLRIRSGRPGDGISSPSTPRAGY